MKLIQTIQALRNATPGAISATLHEQFKESLKHCEFDIEKLKLALDEAKFKDSLGMKDAVAEVLCHALCESQPHDIEVDTYLRNGKYIEAIKLYRNRHGTGLAESKQIIDVRKAQLGL
jgi:ribosomal protein L7/L12